MRAEPARGLSHGLSAVLAAPADVSARRLAVALEHAGIGVVATIDPEETPSAGIEAHADVSVLACATLDAGALAAIRALREHLPETVIVVVAAEAANRDVREALSEGADGFVLERRVDATLGQTIQAVCAGQLVVPGEWRERVGRPVLSPREKQVLGLVVMGFTNHEVAGELHVAESTVKSHLTSIFAKLGVRGRSEAAALVLDPESGLGTGVLAVLERPR
ncbi:MAG TPA: response regulator transcription factor [Gaiellaceae bacterium]|jgi:DNA-binding NarL/FixJ family response regulator|nr:response regulator transcription factor [Gaiellaceae bacterium]